MKCYHNDGWVIRESDNAINIGEDDDIIVTCVCNANGCNEERRLKIIVVDIEPLR